MLFSLRKLGRQLWKPLLGSHQGVLHLSSHRIYSTRHSTRQAQQALLAAMSTSLKRSAPTSPVKGIDQAGQPSKKAAKVVANAIEDVFDDDDVDTDALIAATAAAEEEHHSMASSSQTSYATANGKHDLSSSQSSVVSHKPVTPVKASTGGGGLVNGTPSSKSLALTHGDERVERETMDKEWYERLQSEMRKSYFLNLKSFLNSQTKAGKTIYPPANLIHSWSRLTPLSKVKVVVVGQDPYHGPRQACGHSFSVPKGVNVPGSLLNIYKELKNEYGSDFVQPKHGNLDGWARQGVLLLNACLTVEAGQAGSHHNKGWEPFTQAILKGIVQEATSNTAKPSIKQSTIANMFGKAAAKQNVGGGGGGGGETKKPAGAPAASSQTANTDMTASSAASPSRGVVFLAWGLPAAKTLAEAGVTEKTPNVLLLKSAHPSPLSAHRGFIGNGHFKKANDWLQADIRYGPKGGIDWTDLP